MTKSPDDQIDPYEPRLTRRVGAFAEGGVRAIDPMAVAAAAQAGARRQTLAGRLFGSPGATARLGVVLAGALVGVVALAVALGAGGSTTPIASGPNATPTDVPGIAADCQASSLTGQITGWDGAAGHRIATVKLHNNGSTTCELPQQLRPALIDGAGRALIVGNPVAPSATTPFLAGAELTSMVDMANYCGAEPAPPLKIRLYLPDETSIELPPVNSLPFPVDPPPCNGPNAPSSIQIQAFDSSKPAGN
ncbi:MAG TPA: DUF4232 domain-containing protein [Patescibacteria group bacterium]|nr:DUF4232 domain-containing protein [Patescibacteria group bacterium]